MRILLTCDPIFRHVRCPPADEVVGHGVVRGVDHGPRRPPEGAGGRGGRGRGGPVVQLQRGGGGGESVIFHRTNELKDLEKKWTKRVFRVVGQLSTLVTLLA